jgi:lysozyme family protein
MKSEFEKALVPVLAHEGGYVNHPKDPGGATNKGVTQGTFNAYLTRHGQPSRSVRTITDAEVKAIYKAGYWDAVRGDDMPPGVGYVLFDFAVNSGPSRAIKTMQVALGVTPDGAIGNATMAALDETEDHDALITDICARRIAFMRRLSTWSTFGKGWSRRVANVQERGQAWARGSVGPAVEYDPAAARKARDSEAKARPGTGAADAMTGAGAAGGGGAATIEQAKDALAPLAGDSPFIGKLFAGLVVVSAVMVIGGLAWRFWQARKQKAYDEAIP